MSVAAASARAMKPAFLIHPSMIPGDAGQGTAMAELEDCPEPLDVVIAGIGGGGLISGIAVCAKARSPKILVVGVEPSGAASMTASIQAGKLVELPSINTIADTLSARKVGPLTLETVVGSNRTVEDANLVSAISRLWGI
jgi:threonine dehydratase